MGRKPGLGKLALLLTCFALLTVSCRAAWWSKTRVSTAPTAEIAQDHTATTVPVDPKELQHLLDTVKALQAQVEATAAQQHVRNSR